MSSSLVALVLIGAISVALEEITNKHLVRKLGNEFAQIALVNFLTVAWIPAIVFVIIPGINKLGIVSLEAKLILNVGWPAFWFAMIVAILNIVIRFLDFKSYLDDMSKIAPIKGVTIIFLVPVGYFYLNEKLEPLGIIGLAIIAMGVWLLGFKDLKFRTLISGVLSPLASLWRCRETRYALLAAFIASFALVNEKRAVMSVADEIAAAFSIVFLYKFALAFM
ncbi:MAG TPA: hypothetical protein VJK25_03940, partial [Patescibacteria group bacterium]|nr:hypothetical protein [Patescibacteria group bacterium]